MPRGYKIIRAVLTAALIILQTGMIFVGHDALGAPGRRALRTAEIYNRKYIFPVSAAAQTMPFDVFTPGSDDFTAFPDMAQALNYARRFTPAFIYHWGSGRLLWDNSMSIPPAGKTDVPVVFQMPELPRGCEVTSLAMLLLSQGIEAGKLDLALRVKKDDTPYQIKKDGVFYGNPYAGFVGRMDSYAEPGYGVYHGPVAALLDEYMPGMALDLTGCEFNDLIYYLALDIPVWVIINTAYAPLPQSAFITWNTRQGPVRITYREHSALLCGYDETYVYFNDPLTGAGRADRQRFAAVWEQMGRQAVTVMP